MKNIVYFIVLFFYGYSYSQSFEGRLVYQIDYSILGDSLLGGISKNLLLENLKLEGNIPTDTITYLYSSKGNYVSVSRYNNVEFINTYLKKHNLIYTFTGDLSIVTAIDTSIDLEEKNGNKPIIEILDIKEKIGKYECSIVQVRWKAGTYKYYFYEGLLKVNPELFKDYKYDQFYEFLKISKSLPLKIEKQINDFYSITYKLYYYNEEKINYNIFDIPKMEEEKELSEMYPNKRIFVIK